MRNEDKTVAGALLALAGQVKDKQLRERVEAAIRGDEPKATKPDGIKQKVISGREAGLILGVKARTIRNLAEQGAIARARFPGRVRACGYVRESVEALAVGGVA